MNRSDISILKRCSISEVSTCSYAKFIDFSYDYAENEVDLSVKVDGMAFSFGVLDGKFFTCSASLGPFFSDGNHYETPYSKSVASTWNMRLNDAMRGLDIAHSYLSTGKIGKWLRTEKDIFFRCELLSNVSARKFDFDDNTVTFNYVPYSLENFGSQYGLGSLMSIAVIKIYYENKDFYFNILSLRKLFNDGSVMFLRPQFNTIKPDASVKDEIHHKFGSAYAAKKAMLGGKKEIIKDIVDRGRIKLAKYMIDSLNHYKDVIANRPSIIPTVQNEGIVATSSSGINLKLTDSKFYEFKEKYSAEDNDLFNRG